MQSNGKKFENEALKSKDFPPNMHIHIWGVSIHSLQNRHSEKVLEVSDFLRDIVCYLKHTMNKGKKDNFYFLGFFFKLTALVMFWLCILFQSI